MAFGSQQGPPSFDTYEVLGVAKSATAREIKLAYFKEAKKHHPDMNPGDTQAKERFQRAADAYEILSDLNRRAAYDRHPFNQHTYNQYQQHNQSTSRHSYGQHGYGQHGGFDHPWQWQHTARSAEEIFRQVMQDQEVIREAVSMYTEDLQDEVYDAGEAVRRGDWASVSQIARRNKGLVAGVLAIGVPLALAVRFPGPLLFLGRAAVSLASTVLYTWVNYNRRFPQNGVGMGFLWSRLVDMAHRQREQSLAQRAQRDRWEKDAAAGVGGGAGAGARRASGTGPFNSHSNPRRSSRGRSNRNSKR